MYSFIILELTSWSFMSKNVNICQAQKQSLVHWLHVSRFSLPCGFAATIISHFGNTRHLFPHQDDHADDAPWYVVVVESSDTCPILASVPPWLTMTPNTTHDSLRSTTTRIIMLASPFRHRINRRVHSVRLILSLLLYFICRCTFHYCNYQIRR